MSQRSEKLRRHFERQDDELRFQGQRIDALEAAVRKTRRRARQAENTALKWCCCTYLAITAMVL